MLRISWSRYSTQLVQDIIAMWLLQQFKHMDLIKNAVWVLEFSYLNKISYKIMDFGDFIRLLQT